MQQFTQFAQSVTYNCADSTDSSYGAGNFGTCEAASSTTPGTTSPSTGNQGTTSGVGVPNTGFLGLPSSATFSIVLPIVVAVVIVAVAAVTAMRKKAKKQQ